MKGLFLGQDNHGVVYLWDFMGVMEICLAPSFFGKSGHHPFCCVLSAPPVREIIEAKS